jgi:Sulfotransferase domain
MSMTETERPFLTIVSGLPRSGTSLMMKMLEAGGLPVLVDGVRTADVDNPRGYYEFEPVKRLKEDTSWVAPACGKAVKMVYLLLLDLPPDVEYRVLFMRRNIDEVLASQAAMLRRLGKSAPLDDARMAALFRDGLAKFDGWVKDRPNFRLLDVSYNALVTDAAPVAAEVDQFLGLGLDVDAMTRIVDPTLYRNRAT